MIALEQMKSLLDETGLPVCQRGKPRLYPTFVS